MSINDLAKHKKKNVLEGQGNKSTKERFNSKVTDLK